jgi:hypothetical protein
VAAAEAGQRRERRGAYAMDKQSVAAAVVVADGVAAEEEEAGAV